MTIFGVLQKNRPNILRGWYNGKPSENGFKRGKHSYTYRISWFFVATPVKFYVLESLQISKQNEAQFFIFYLFVTFQTNKIGYFWVNDWTLQIKRKQK